MLDVKAKGALSQKIFLPGVIVRWTGVALFVLLTSLGALIRIPLPFTPVPVTLQTFFVLLGASFLGSRQGALTQIIYLALGLVGIPLFAGGGGIAYLLGPTGGYLLGFILAAWLVGKIMEGKTRKTFIQIILTLTAGMGIIYLLGMLHLSLFLRVGLGKGFTLAILPFLPGACLKLIVAASIYRTLIPKFR